MRPDKSYITHIAVILWFNRHIYLLSLPFGLCKISQRFGNCIPSEIDVAAKVSTGEVVSWSTELFSISSSSLRIVTGTCLISNSHCHQVQAIHSINIYGRPAAHQTLFLALGWRRKKINKVLLSVSAWMRDR